MIRPLDPSVRAQLRSGVSVPSVAQCVEELVLNSLDAAATCIAVRIDLENFWIQVVDNGNGIPKDQLTIVGERYATSKCHTVTDLENLNFFGYRGEALASIAQVCAVLEIESRHKASTKVNNKVFRHGKVVSVFESKSHRPTCGTTVTAHNVFHNLPVRQKFVSVSLERERIRERVAAIALIHPSVSFTLRHENLGGKYLQTHKTNSLVSCFGSLFGAKKSLSLREASHQHKQFNISGYISREGHRNKDLQFLYINNRLILRTKVHKFLNLLLSKSTVVNRRAGQWEPRTPTVRDNTAADASSPGKQRDYYGMFVLNITCPLSEYDVSLDPAKTLVEFKEWEALLTCVQDMVQKFLKQENLTMSLDLNVGEQMGSLLQDEEITTREASLSRSKPTTAVVDLQKATNNSGVDYGEGISTLNKVPKYVCNQQEANRDNGGMAVDSAGLCGAEKVWNQELTEKLRDDHANLEQGLEQIVPGRHCGPSSGGVNFRKVNDVWAQQFDQARGVEVYVNLMTGHTQLDCPEDNKEDIGASSSMNVSMSAGGEKKWRGTVHPFLTHNATPFLPRGKRSCQDVDEDMVSTSSTQHALGQMLAAHRQEQEEEGGSGVKWRDRVPNEPDESDNEESVAQLWDSWENPVFSRTEQSILNVAAGTGGTARVRSVMQPYRFSREMLHSIQIIGQVDNKFIACMMKNSAHNFTTSSAPNLLVLIDQHAAHERVRLEKLHDDLYEPDPGSPHQHLKFSHVIPPLEVPLPAEELRLLQAYKSAFQRLGVNVSTDNNRTNTAIVSSLPCCVVEREYNERKRGRLAVAVELVESLIKEHLEVP
ncbi:MLH3 [Branchiostoma lanceolatum]|uniref:MLH3 protein n=1 Tax=Branchiostoma lanceolatum TaxID=7740 RepID=A0A8K0EP11_BRALA|nr:MLH3 [Branchiostoma lanceolatum]